MTPRDGAWPDWLARRAAERAQAGLVRRRVALDAPDAVTLRDGTREWLNFSGNDYLGLRHHPRVVRALQAAADTHGAGAGAAALVTGYTRHHQQLEEALADFLGREAVLLCSSGWLANLAAIGALAGRGDRVVQDRLSHASLIDAARLAGASLKRYPHADADAADRLLAAQSTGRTLLVTDGLFSMDGDVAPLADLVRVARGHDAWLVVDDAHGIGVLGDGGRGCVAGAGWDTDAVPVLTGTLGKALGAAGAFVAGSHALIEHLVNEGRAYVYDTALPAPVVAAASAALAVLRDDPEPRERLSKNVQRFRDGVRALGLDAAVPGGPIQPVPLGSSQRALDVSAALRERGLWVTAIRPPTVPRGSARLRVTLSAAHTDEHVDRLLDGLDACARN